METFLTCAVLVTSEALAQQAGLSLQLGTTAGTAFRVDPHLPDVFYLEASTLAESPGEALEAAAKAAATVVAEHGRGLTVEELTVIGPLGVTHWSADEHVGSSPV